MNIVTDTCGLRFERSYNDIYTILEGEELQNLFTLYLRVYDSQTIEDKKSGKALVYSVVNSYLFMYPGCVVTEEDLAELNTGDSRKMDLFFRGILELYSGLAGFDDEITGKINKFDSVLSVLNEMIEIKPNFMGVGLNLNAIFKMLRRNVNAK